VLKSNWSGVLAPASMALRKDMGRAMCYSAPLIPTALRIKYFENFSRILEVFLKILEI